MSTLREVRAATAICGSDPQSSSLLGGNERISSAPATHTQEYRCDVSDEFFAITAPIKQLSIDWLIGKGVAPLVICRDDEVFGGYVIGQADVVVKARRFEFAEKDEAERQTALIFVARDRFGDPDDLVAWLPKAGATASLYGRASVLGEQTLYGSRFAGPPPVHRTVLDWLKARRDGVVIVDPTRAARTLIDSPGKFAAADPAHARELAALLTASLELARIVIPAQRVPS